jgi:hypothetical protein
MCYEDASRLFAFFVPWQMEELENKPIWRKIDCPAKFEVPLGGGDQRAGQSLQQTTTVANNTKLIVVLCSMDPQKECTLYFLKVECDEIGPIIID